MKTTHGCSLGRLRITILLVSVVTFSLCPLTAKVGQAASAESTRRMGYVSPSFNLVKKVQRTLIQKGYDPGPVDGLWGPRTRAAVRQFQRDHDMQTTNFLTQETLKRLFSE